MLDLTKKDLPDSVMVDGRSYFIKTDFRIWIQFERDFKTQKNFNCTYIFVDDFPPYVDITALLEFARPKKELPRPIRHSDVISLDFDIDADYIYAAFMEQYGIDLFEVDLHWHKFLALLNGLNEEVTLSKIMSYRNYRKNTSKRDPYEELKKAWEIIPPNEEDNEEIDMFESQFL